MPDPKKKHCTNAACALRDTEITTDADECVSCGRPLTEALADIMKRAFGEANDNPFSGMFGSKKP